jgi:hypothetical protein
LDQPRTQWIKYFTSKVGTYHSGNDVRQTVDGGFIITGTTSLWGVRQIGNYIVHFLISYIYLVRTDKLGNLVWQKTYQYSEYEDACSSLQTADGGFLVVGTLNLDVYLMKIDNGGNFLWQKTYGGDKFDQGTCLEETFDGGYIIAGNSSSFGNTGVDFYLIKIDASGNLLWQKTYGGAGDDYARSVQQTMDGGFIVAGDTDSSGSGETDFYLIKTDSAGNLLWQKTFGVNSYDYGRSVQPTYDGGYVLAGEISSKGSTDSSIYLIKTDGLGNFLWQKLFGATGSNGANAVIQTLDGGLLIAGYENAIGKSLIRMDRLGNIRWQTQSGSTIGSGSFRSVRQTYDRGFIVTGDDGSSISLVKMAPENPRIMNERRR